MRRTCFTAAFIATALATSIAGAQTPATAAQPTAAQPTAGTPAVAAPAVTAPAAATPVAPPPAINTGIRPPADYVVGIDDQLEVIYWQDKDMSAAVVVRPDGNISLPLLNDVQAAGRTPEELRVAITEAATKFVEGPTVSVVVKAINSRKVFITGQIGKPGPYPLMDAMTVVQLIATAGGPTEYAKSDKITILRNENGRQVLLKFNYKNVSQGKSLDQNIVLKPGDSIMVP